MQAKQIIILAILLVYIATTIMANSLYNEASAEDSAFEERRSDLSETLRDLLANKRRVRF